MHATPTLAVGELLITPGDLRLGHERKRVFLIEGGTTRTVGTTSEVLSIEMERGVPSLRRVQTLDSRELGMLRVEVLMSPSTLAPLRSQSAGLLGASALAYHEGEVRGSIADVGGSATAVAHPLDRPVFDAYAVEVILRTLPLQVGYEVRIPAYVAPARAVVPVVARVEALDGGAWRVAADFGTLRSTYWIEAETRTFLRQDIPLSSGATLSFRR